MNELEVGDKFRLQKNSFKYTVDRIEGTVIYFSSKEGITGKIDLKMISTKIEKL